MAARLMLLACAPAIVMVAALGAQSPGPDDKNPLAGSAAAISAGARTFQRTCLSCHGDTSRAPSLGERRVRPRRPRRRPFPRHTLRDQRLADAPVQRAECRSDLGAGRIYPFAFVSRHDSTGGNAAPETLMPANRCSSDEQGARTAMP